MWELGREFERARIADAEAEAREHMRRPAARSWEEQVAARRAELDAFAERVNAARAAAAGRIRRPDQGERRRP